MNEVRKWLVSSALKHIQMGRPVLLDGGGKALTDFCKVSVGVTWQPFFELSRCGAMMWCTTGARTKKAFEERSVFDGRHVFDAALEGTHVSDAEV